MNCKDCPAKITLCKEGKDEVTKEEKKGVYQCTIGYSAETCPIINPERK